MRFVMLSDPHLGDTPSNTAGLDTPARFISALDAALATRPDALVMGGDYSFGEPRSQDVCTVLAAIRERTEIPLHFLAGNHDSPADLAAGLGPDLPVILPADGHYYRTELPGGVGAVVLDSSAAQLSEVQWNWLTAELERDGPQLLFIHHPPYFLGRPFMDNKHPFQQINRFARLMAACENPPAIFSGHYHANGAFLFDRVRLQLCPPTSFFVHPDRPEFSEIERRPGFLVVDITDGRIGVRTEYA
ncbi:MAG: metallophosphoesterase [Saprospiraceae bacterium]